MRVLRDLGLTIAVGALVVGCSSMLGTRQGAPTPVPTPRPTRTVSSLGSVALALETSTAVARLTPLRTPTPTVFFTPTITPTLGPPTPTPTPAPDPDTASAAQSVDDALVAFAQAQAAGDPQALLKAQRALLAAAATAAPVANGDPTPYGQILQNALADVNAAATGNYDQMVAAHKALTQLTGGGELSGTPVASLPRPPAQAQPVSVAQVTANLQKAVNEYITATNSGNQGSLLTAQRDLLQATAAADAASKVGTTPDALQLQKVVTLLNDGFRGDTGKFQDAANALGTMNPQQAAAATGTGATPRAAATAGAQVDMQPFENDVDNKLQALQQAEQNSDKSGLQNAENDLKNSIQKAQDAIANDQSPAANQMRNALGHAMEAASGDANKIQVARDGMKAAVGQ